jgi:hypothetical protein
VFPFPRGGPFFWKNSRKRRFFARIQKNGGTRPPGNRSCSRAPRRLRGDDSRGGKPKKGKRRISGAFSSRKTPKILKNPRGFFRSPAFRAASRASFANASGSWYNSANTRFFRRPKPRRRGFPAGTSRVRAESVLTVPPRGFLGAGSPPNPGREPVPLSENASGLPSRAKRFRKNPSGVFFRPIQERNSPRAFETGLPRSFRGIPGHRARIRPIRGRGAPGLREVPRGALAAAGFFGTFRDCSQRGFRGVFPRRFFPRVFSRGFFSRSPFFG